MVQRLFDVPRREAVAALHVQHDARIERAAAGGHHQPVERREAHGRVDAAAARHGRSRAAVAEVADHQPQLLHGAAEQLGGAAGAVGVAQAVEAVAADPPLARPARGHRVGARSRREAGMEGGVEDRDVRNLRKRRLRRRERLQTWRVVQRRQLGERGDPRADVGRDAYGSDELAAVHHAMSDRREHLRPRAGTTRARNQIAERAAHRLRMSSPRHLLRAALTVRCGARVARDRAGPVRRGPGDQLAILGLHQRALQAARPGVQEEDPHEGSRFRLALDRLTRCRPRSSRSGLRPALPASSASR